MRISDWSSDVCSSDLVARNKELFRQNFSRGHPTSGLEKLGATPNRRGTSVSFTPDTEIFGPTAHFRPARLYRLARSKAYLFRGVEIRRSEEHTSELQSLMRISYAVFCLKKKKYKDHIQMRQSLMQATK